MGGWYGVALRRAAHDGSLVLAAAAIVLVAAGVLVAAAVYPDAVVRAGIVRSLQDADPIDSSIGISTVIRGPDVATFDETVRREVAAALAPAPARISSVARSDAYDLFANGRGLANGSGSLFAYADGLQDGAHLVRGAWPSDTPTTAANGLARLEAVVSEGGAGALGVDVGDLLTATSRLDRHHLLQVRIVGVVAPNDPADPAWASDPLLSRGLETRGSFTTAGPLFVGRNVLLGQALSTQASVSWRAVPDFRAVTAESVGGIGANVQALGVRLAGQLGTSQSFSVTTKLPTLLGAISGQLAEARSGSALVAGQLVVLAMYALVFVAAIIVGQRRTSTSLLRARGAAPRHLVLLSLVEAAVLAIPAAGLGLPLGLALASWLAGSAAGVRLSNDLVILAGVAALVAIVGLTLPTGLAAGPLASVRRSPGRQRAAALMQRSRLDLAIAVLALIALWRLRTSAGSSDIASTPLAVIGPAAGLLAGAILLLRAVPLLGGTIERSLVRRRSADRALTVRSVARRSVAAARPALLVAMSAATGVFATGYGLTWQAAQRDQAAFAVGADIRADVASGVTTADATDGSRVPSVSTGAAADRAIPGVTAVAAIDRESFSTGSDITRGTLLALTPESARTVVPFRPDLASSSLDGLLGGLIAARPAPPAIALPPDTRRVRVQIAVPASVPATARLRVEVVARAADGLLTRLSTTPALGSPADPFVATLDGPSEILAIELHFAGAGALDNADIAIAGIEASSSAGGADWASVADQATLSGWSVSDAPASGLVAASGSLATLAAQGVAALVDPAVLASTGAKLGDSTLIRQGFAASRKIRVLDWLAGFPGVDAPGLVVVDLASLQLATYAATGTIPGPTEWRLAVAPGTDRAVIAALTAHDPTLATLRSRAVETAARLNDPIVVAIAGMLVLAAIGAGAFALVGFVTAAWSSTASRVPEYAVGRALGLTRGAVRRWVALEQAFPAAAGLAWGIGLGIALEWLVVPAVIQAPGPGLVSPAALVVVPVLVIAGYLAVALSLVILLGVALARHVERAGLTEPLRGEP